MTVQPQAGREKNGNKDATRIYLKEVSKTPLLKHEDEIRLSKEIEAAKKQMLTLLFEIPQCVRAFDQAMIAVVSGDQTTTGVFDVEEHADQALLKQVHSLRTSIQEYADGGFVDVTLKQSIAELISDLPLKPAFFDQLIQPVSEVVKHTTQTAGEFLRWAITKGVTREQFLSNYQNAQPSSVWHAFVTKHSTTVNEYQQRLAQLSSGTGLSSVDLQAKIGEIRVQQRALDSAVETMLKSNLRLVVSVAKKYINVSSTPLLDLVQEGNIGLLKAIDKFNYKLGFRFSTYATWWIKQCVLKALNEQHRIIRVPSHMTDLVKLVSRATVEYSSSHGYDPSVWEIAQMLRMDVNTVKKVWTVAQGTISLETPIGSEEEQSLGAIIEDVDGVNSFDQIAEQDSRNAVSAVLRDLTAKEERVIRMRFGIGVESESTLEDIGHTIGVTRERIRQIEYKALQKLREPELAGRIQSAFE